MADKKQPPDNPAIQFVIYDPEKEGEKLCLCRYLAELPEVGPEEIGEYPEK